jgi:glycosyltransferase involved in cell wall biosynthesis
MKISGYILCYNNESTILESVESLKNQTYKLNEIFVIDDGSKDNSVSILKKNGIRVYQNFKNKGRGYSRNRAIKLSKCDYVLCCDATNTLSTDFVAESIIHLENNYNISSISGRLVAKQQSTFVDAWRSKHLFKEDVFYPSGVQETELLITYGTLMRKKHILECNNFDPLLTKNEDYELGVKLINNGYKLLGHTDVFIYSIVSNSLLQVMERYWRWHFSADQKMNFINYLKLIKACLNPMGIEDLRKYEFKSFFISMLLPHYCFIKSNFGK